MSIQVALHHSTRYTYDRAINLGPQLVRLRPAPHCRTPILSYALNISPGAHFLNWQQDPQSNWLARVVVPEKTEHLTVTVDLVAELNVINPFDFFLEPEAEVFPFAYAPEVLEDLKPFLHTVKVGPRFLEYLAAIPRLEKPTTGFLFDLNAQLQRDIGYLIRMEPGIQAPDETLEKASGSCRDSAWLLVQLLRHLGLAARFASGYLVQLKPDQKSLDGPSGTDVDFTDLHAWCEVFLPGAGWVGLDPTSGLFAGEGHIPLACAANPTHAAPITGALDECEVSFEFEMTVTRVAEPPRVTKPYTDDQWRAIDALGDRIDALLKDGDVRLTMGGEPTFVSIDDMDGAEWTTAAVGPTKRDLADTLIRRLRDRFAPGGFLHYGQGKWYPGESLPRWAFALYWRGDGMPLWRDPDRIARERADHRPTIEDAKNMIQGIARRLDIHPDYAMPAFEDPLHYIGKETALPVNVDPFDPKLDDAEERARLTRVFGRGLSKAAGFVLPVQRWNAPDRRRWRSERWVTRAGRLQLMPGDSPVGFRLPLNALPWLPPTARPYIPPPDPFDELPPLPERDAYRQPYFAGATRDAAWEARRARIEQEAPVEGASVRTALSVEPRDGRLCVFMPPTESAADYLDLLAAIEDAAAECDVALHIEGYSPPYDPRINVIKVTPDPGVIEVNIHPARSWREQVAITEALYEEARQTRLGTEKFMLDGRHTGTGGGNHIVLGAAHPADSPFLRRPDLLKSLVAYWQNHPSLSYMFSGLFIGPTSQAPRIDEARLDSLYEMEIAFSEVPERNAGNVPPWLVDRIFRNLLIDVTGNTHRTEICIDKLYSPDGPGGRLGLVEFRGFEVPPHPEMSLTQGLLLRALIARFWAEPYKASLVRWGTALHDSFMLPHFVWADFADVIADLNAHGFAFDAEWFRPHWAFRFPLAGKVQYGGVNLEIRQALEPWNVMGEEGAVGGTVRFVDSSVERLEVKAKGMVDGRHKILVNRRAVPLKPISLDEFVGGVRFRAWAPPSTLHPTIPSHAPLTIEVWDGWRKRSLGGCTYHVGHPGGRNYVTFPVNAYEAEGRRLSRFEPFGFTGGIFAPAPEAPHPDFPHTLDLRRP
ncbi:MAG: transglutaminase family protein [Proteobacteria bacterium]|nr:transglutaminase family protein [Pseudomonadota bacterium]